MEENSSDRRSGCGILNMVFGRRGFWAKKSMADNGSHKSMISSNTNASSNVTAIQYTKSPGSDMNPKKVQVSPADVHKVSSEPIQNQKPVVSKPTSNQYPNNHQLAGYGGHQPHSNGNRNSNCNSNDSHKGPSVQQQVRKLPREAMGLSGELEIMIADHQKTRGNSSLVRASSSNVMLFGDLGNVRQPGTAGNCSNSTTNNQTAIQSNLYANSAAGTLGVRRASNEERTAGATKSQDQSGSLCRAISTRMDPETLKIMGNEDYKNGNFPEAIALYDAAIAIDPNKASYHSNKSAALTAMGRILEAVFECREAIRIEPHYHRAHHRLGNLYLRLGEVEKSMYHFKHSGPEADRDDIPKAKTVQTHLNKCTQAKRLRDWNNLIKETANTISAGADSAPQVYALQAEALLKTHRHQEAEDALSKSPNFDVESCTKYYGPIGYANFLVVRAQVDLSAGRFEDALEAIQRAAKMDGNNREVSVVLRRGQAVTAARAKGNEMFKVGRLKEACEAYGEGLDHDPRNSVLLCNRAACRSKMGEFDRAIEDCTAALALRPRYAKARLRRADCNAKIGNWEKTVEDYEILKKERPEDEEVARGLSEAQQQLHQRRGHGS